MRVRVGAIGKLSPEAVPLHRGGLLHLHQAADSVPFELRALPTYVEAAEPGAVREVICSTARDNLIGWWVTQTGKTVRPQAETDWEVEVVRWPEGTPLERAYLVGRHLPAGVGGLPGVPVTVHLRTGRPDGNGAARPVHSAAD